MFREGSDFVCVFEGLYLAVRFRKTVLKFDAADDKFNR